MKQSLASNQMSVKCVSLGNSHTIAWSCFLPLAGGEKTIFTRKAEDLCVQVAAGKRTTVKNTHTHTRCHRTPRSRFLIDSW